MKERLDVLLVSRGLAPSREKAKTMIMEGNVFVNNNREDKAGSTFPDDCKIEIHGNTLKYVSRGGLKLEKAMTHFGITLDGKVCMDIGASTGGFTDCMAKYLSWDMLFKKSYYATARDELEKNKDSMNELEWIGKNL